MNKKVLILSFCTFFILIPFVAIAGASDEIDWDVNAGVTYSYANQTVEIEGTIYNPSDKNTKNVAILIRVKHESGRILRDFSINVGKVEAGDTESFSHTEYNMDFKLGEQKECDTEYYDIQYEIESGCLIATATFGSELSPQVQFLRNFRDHHVLSTFAGSQFMEVFNSFYYTWSPSFADTIRASEGFGTTMKGVLYPLIGVLQASEKMFSALSFNSELSIIITGFITSILLALIYLVPFALVIAHLGKYRSSKVLISAMGIIWIASLMGIGLAEIVHTPALMMTATGTFVLSTIGMTILMAIRQFPILSAMYARLAS